MFESRTLVLSVGVALTIVSGAISLGLATALSGLVRMLIWVPITLSIAAVVIGSLLRGRGGSSVAVANVLLVAGLAGCTLLAPYSTQSAKIPAGDHTLAATLYVPDGDPPHPAVVIIHGSTCQTRNSLGGLYRSNAQLFARNGFAALVYDKRGCGDSTGNFESALMPEFADDAKAALAYVAAREDVDARRVGVWGISAGGWVAPMVARDNDDVAFVVLASAPVVPEADQRLYEWGKRIRADGASEAYIANALSMRRRVWKYYATGEGWNELSQDLDAARNRPWWSSIHAVFPGGVAPPEKLHPPGAEDPYRWYRTDCFRDPEPIVRSLSQPVISFYGSSDTVIDVDRNISLMRRVVRERRAPSRLVVIEGANHALVKSIWFPRFSREYRRELATWLHDR